MKWAKGFFNSANHMSKKFRGTALSKSFPIVLTLFLISRLIALVVRVPLLVGSTKYYDYLHFLSLARLSDLGLYPYIHYWLEYPPVFPWLSVLIYRAVLAVAAGSPLLVEALYQWLTASMRLAGEIASFMLIYFISRHLWGQAKAIRSAWLYLLLFVPYYLWNGAFDPLPTLLFLASLAFLITGREKLSSIAAAVGFMTKIFPVLIVPLAACSIRKMQRKMIYIILFAFIAALIAIPFIIMNSDMFLASFKNMFGRREWETVWALWEGNYNSGEVAAVSARTELHASAQNAGSGIFGSIPPLLFALISGAFYYFFWGTRTSRQILAAGGFSIHILLIFSPGYSPQFLTWIAPLIAIVFPNRKGAVYLGFLGIANLLEYPVYFHFHFLQPIWLVIPVLMRTTMLVIIAGDYCRMAIFPKIPSDGWDQRASNLERAT